MIAFQVLLLSAAALLASGNASGANEVAAYAFYALVVGIAIQAITIVRERKKRSQPDDDSGSKST